MSLGDWTNTDREPSREGVARYRDVPGGRLYQVGIALPSGQRGIMLAWSAPVFAPTPVGEVDHRGLLKRVLEAIEHDGNPRYDDIADEIRRIV